MININKAHKQNLFSRINVQMSPNVFLWSGGIAFTFLFALLAYGLAKVPGFDHIGPLACSIIIAVIYRQIWGYPEKIRCGIEFSSKKLLRYAIVLYGLKLNIDVVIHHGLGLLLRDVGTAVFAIVLTVFLAKWMKADSGLSLLLGIGTGICGAAAIAAVSPIVKAKEEDTAIGAGVIALVGTLFAIGYTILRPYIHLTNIQYGIWSGVGLHEIAHVALAAAPAGRDALAIGLLAKLGRVLLLVPLSFILMYWMKRTGKIEKDTKIEFPWFLIGFIIMSIFGSYVVGKHLIIPKTIMNNISTLTTFLLTMAMVGLGLNVSMKALRTKALKPLIAMFITSILLSILTFWMM
ncbi:putative sulfate exporter family transporter [Priestia aryabhattai]|uniref:YeiH family protein n=1 Tax=Priestia aryabhattai TaxID=412384 RepID=UPI001C8DB3ED|nr:putative sulfate exporter family transporter [Priestia aryabhattai]MBY0029216.1 putative sulfate exporter family transporter [Priestia aryabhattai]